MTYALTWLADVLRQAGLNVVEQPGWQSRGRAEMGKVQGLLAHHTGKGETPGLLNLITNGRTDLAGPLSQLYLDRKGVWYVIGAGRCNHAGAGRWQNVTDGNGHLIGIEAQNAGDGKDPWPAAQMESYARGCAAMLKHIGADAVMLAGHKEYALPRGRKTDPSFDMVAFREVVEDVMDGTGSPVGTASQPVQAATLTDPKRAMLRKGDHGESVKVLQLALKIEVDGSFGPGTEKAVKAFQAAHQLTADGLVGPGTWKALNL